MSTKQISQLFSVSYPCKHSVRFSPSKKAQVDGSDVKKDITGGLYLFNETIEVLGRPEKVKLTVEAVE